MRVSFREAAVRSRGCVGHAGLVQVRKGGGFKDTACMLSCAGSGCFFRSLSHIQARPLSHRRLRFRALREELHPTRDGTRMFSLLAPHATPAAAKKAKAKKSDGCAFKLTCVESVGSAIHSIDESMPSLVPTPPKHSAHAVHAKHMQHKAKGKGN